MKRIGIIGVGQFGSTLAERLVAYGADVLLMDQNQEAVQEFSEYVTRAIKGDATNLRTLEDAGFKACDIVVIAIGSLEASIIATVNCKDLEIPNVVVKASSLQQGKILKRVGASLVVYPNRDCSRRLARSLLAHGSMDLFEISDGFNIAEIDVPDLLRNKNLAESKVRNKFGVTVLCLRRINKDPEQPRDLIIPSADEIILPDDKLIIFGENKKIDAFCKVG